MKNSQKKKSFKDKLREMAIKAKIILSNAPYIKQREFIDLLFQNKIIEEMNLSHEDIVQLRLILIDALYSTNMWRKPYSIDQLAKALANQTDEELKIDITELVKYIKNEVQRDRLGYAKANRDMKKNLQVNKIIKNIRNLINKCYGIHKYTGKGERAFSILTKYFYFLLNHEFPICDKRVKNSYEFVVKRMINSVDENLRLKGGKNTFAAKLNDENIYDFIKGMEMLRNVLGNDIDYDCLDNLLWLIDKLNRNSRDEKEINFSLLLSPQKYKDLITLIKIPDIYKTKSENNRRRIKEENNKREKEGMRKSLKKALNKKIAEEFYNRLRNKENKENIGKILGPRILELLDFVEEWNS